MSARSVPSSQRTTASRKLAIITPTPMAADTAIISAAMATAVRESAAAMPRVARRPRSPKARPAIGWSRRSSTSDAAGATKAQPIITTNRPAKPPAMPPPGQDRIAAPPARSPRPSHVARVTDRRALVSSAARLITTRGGAPVASSAGPSAASAVAPMPSSTPLPSVSGSRATSRTESTKYRSLIVRVTRPRSPRAMPSPSRRPAAVPTAPIRSASPITSAKISARDTPMARSEPMSGRRCTTENAVVW